MKITQIKNTENTPLDNFKNANFNLELTGEQLLFLLFVSRRIGGSSKVRRFFSDGNENLEGVIRCLLESKNLDIFEILDQMDEQFKAKGENNGLYINE